MQNIRKMWKKYGMGEEGKCSDCCNLHYHPDYAHEEGCTTYACVAYGVAKGKDCTWDPNEISCKLYNRPFLAIRPALRPLVESEPGVNPEDCAEFF